MGARPKFSYLRDKRYLRYVASFACFCCGLEGHSQAAHSNQSRHGKGGAVKASDEYTFPLCIPHGKHQGCHSLHDLCVDMTREEREEKENEYIERMWRYAKRDGWR